ncbi:PhzF family phenazine biosynthesis protein [Cellulophaga baltica]|uniref:PhzF family phenazine biosynthesis protein n=1 Tax=Cellulophaga TaxID=104264 RepID=UPI001C06945A|nr:MULTISPECIES: PhzF family phenazine biosynthesis protein [Cellulophaga]MBU2997116.1 PhzF family phenazine biosynthesis protein [Cellulophaga baltica]MDO6768514.1 PhzF family phenazine biosynthesis protein [Cellulophaga sp. 1_MG-2023]
MDNSKKITVQIINAFVENEKGGNPAGVVLNATNLSNKKKQAIAKKVGLSETAFVSESKTEDFKLDFFTPTKQIAHCGHATVATFSYLKQIGALTSNNSSKETIDGRRKIKLSNKFAFMEQLAPKYTDISENETAILKSLSITKNDLLPNASIQIVNTGNSFLLIPVKDTSVLKNLTPNFELVNNISGQYDLIGYYVFTTAIDNTKNDATSRMFAPRYGISEEAGTGMAAGPLACYLHDILKVNKTRFLIQQGKFMKTPSTSLIIVDINIKKGKIKNLMAGGEGKLIKEIFITLDEK